jgi:hypothetical protein
MEKEIEEQTTSKKESEQEETVEKTTEEAGVEEVSEEETEKNELLDKNRKLYERTKKAEEDRKALLKEKEQLEAKLAASTNDDYSEPDDQTANKIAELSAQLSEMREKSALDALYIEYPVLKDKMDEFDEFRQEYPLDKVKSAAKLFLAENDLLSTTTKRKGLEPAKGGKRVPPSTGTRTSEDVKRLRENNFEEYRKQVKEGKIKIE